MSTFVPTDRRHVPDRRHHVTSPWSIFRFRRRRRACRRDIEGHNQYTDHLSADAVFFAILIVVLSLLDALFTLVHLEGGGIREANPVMNIVLIEGVGVFLLVKSVLTILGVLFLAIHHNFRFSAIALYTLGCGYLALTLYHSCLFLNCF